MKVLKFLKSIGYDLLKNILEILGILLSCGLLLSLIWAIVYVIAIPLHIILPKEDMGACGVITLLLILIVWGIIKVIIELTKYFIRKWKEIK